MAPPKPARKLLAVLLLPKKLQLVRDSVPLLRIPPPLFGSVTLPFEMVNPVMLTALLDPIVKMRKFGVPAAVLRDTVNLLAPGPLIVKSEERSSNAAVKVMVPETAVRSIVSEPTLLPAAHSPATDPEAVLLFAAVIASRNVHKPSLPFATSDKLFTVIVVASGLIPPLSANKADEE